MNAALKKSMEGTPKIVDRMAPHAGDPDSLKIDLVRKALEKSRIQAEESGEEKSTHRAPVKVRLDIARQQREAQSTRAPKCAGLFKRMFGGSSGPAKTKRPKAPPSEKTVQVSRTSAAPSGGRRLLDFFGPSGKVRDKMRADPYDRLAAQARKA